MKKNLPLPFEKDIFLEELLAKADLLYEKVEEAYLQKKPIPNRESLERCAMLDLESESREAVRCVSIMEDLYKPQLKQMKYIFKRV